MAKTETSTMAPAKAPSDSVTPAKEPDVAVPPKPAATKRRRRRVQEDAPAELEFGVLEHDELACIGSLLVRARSNGQDPADYVLDLRRELAAWDRMVTLECVDGG